MQKLNETRKYLKRIKLRKVASTMIKKCTNHQSLDLANVELMNQNHLPLKKNKHVSNKKTQILGGSNYFGLQSFKKQNHFKSSIKISKFSKMDRFHGLLTRYP